MGKSFESLEDLRCEDGGAGISTPTTWATWLLHASPLHTMQFSVLKCCLILPMNFRQTGCHCVIGTSSFVKVDLLSNSLSLSLPNAGTNARL